MEESTTAPHPYDMHVSGDAPDDVTLEESLLVTARLWAAVHPAASLDERRLLAARLEWMLMGGMG